MTGPKLNEREGTRAVLRHVSIPANKARQVLDLIRNQPIETATDTLKFSERSAANEILKVVNSAVANAENNDGMQKDELFVSACFADEGRTLGRFRPRARGSGARIRKRTCHITVIVSRLPEDKLAQLREKQAVNRELRRRRVTASRTKKADEVAASTDVVETVTDEETIEEIEEIEEEIAIGEAEVVEEKPAKKKKAAKKTAKPKAKAEPKADDAEVAEETADEEAPAEESDPEDSGQTEEGK